MAKMLPVPVTDYTRKLQPRLCTIEKIAAGAELVARTPNSHTPSYYWRGVDVDEDELDEAADLDTAMNAAATPTRLAMKRCCDG